MSGGDILSRLTDAFIGSVLLSIIAYLIARAVAKTRKDAPRHGSNLLSIWRKGEAATSVSGGGAETAIGSGLVSHDIAHRKSVNSR